MLCAAKKNLDARPSRRPHGCPSAESSHLELSRRMQPHSSSVMHNSSTTLSRPSWKRSGKDDASSNANRLFLLLGLGTLDPRRSAEGLLSVLALLACCPACQPRHGAGG